MKLTLRETAFQKRFGRLAITVFRIFALVAVAICGETAANANVFQETDLRVDLPASAEVRVENQRGSVSVEIWDEPYVSVSVVTDGAASPSASSARNSPVRLERSESLLSIGVGRSRGAAQTRVDLKLRLPAHARAKIFTGSGAIETLGTTRSLAAQTVSGDISVDIAAPPDADLTAHSLNGTVIFKSGLASSVPSEQPLRKKVQTRLGAGSQPLSLFSGRGRITVGMYAPFKKVASGTEAAEYVRGTNTIDVGVVEVGAEPKPQRTPTLVGSTGNSRSAGALQAQKPSDEPQEVDEDEVVRVESDLVTLNMSVIDRGSGRGLTGLAQSDFKLFEDGVEQQLAHFQSSSAPFDLLLLIDLSGSTTPVTNLIRAAALRFISAARAQDRIGVITFAGTIDVVSPLTTNRESLRANINVMEPPKGDTKLYDAVGFAMDFLDKDTTPTRRRAIILMSDGLDSTLPNVTGVGSSLPYEDLRGRVQEFDGTLYTIWTSTEYEAFSPEDIQPETFDLVNRRMQELAEAGGGVSYDVERLEDLAGVYERVVADLGTLYSLSYRPTNKVRDERWRAIRVVLPQLPNAAARGKRGYFAK